MSALLLLRSEIEIAQCDDDDDDDDDDYYLLNIHLVSSISFKSLTLKVIHHRYSDCALVFVIAIIYIPLLTLLSTPLLRPIFTLIDSSGVSLLLLTCILVNLSNEGDIPYIDNGCDGNDK